MTERDETSKLVLSPDYTSEKLHSLVDMLSAFISSPDVQGVSGSSVRVFAEGNVLFTHNYLYYAEQQLNAVPFSYTILPTPKYDGEQDTYYTQVGAAMTLWGIMNDSSVEDKSNFSAVLEVLAYNAYNYTTEMVFQEVYKDVFSETRDNTKMFEYIRNGIRIDRVEVLATVLFNDDVFCTNFNNAVWNGEKWSSVLSVFERVLKNYIKRVVQTYEQLEG